MPNMNDSTPAPMPSDVTVVAHRWIGRLAWILCPVLGATLGWAVPRVVPWVQDLPLLPLDGPLELVQLIAEPQLTVGAMVIGGLGGALLARMVVADLVTVTVTDHEVIVDRGGRRHDVLRAVVHGVFIDGKQLVVLDDRGEELLRQTTDLAADDLRAAFVAHRYPWRVVD